MAVNHRDIVTVDFPSVRGVKRRPALVLSSKAYHAARPDVIVGLITSQTKGLGRTDHIIKEWEKAGLKKPSVFRSFIVTLPPSANLVRIGYLTDDDWREVCQRLAASYAGLNAV